MSGEVVLLQFEKIISQISRLSEQSFAVDKLVALLDFYLQLAQSYEENGENLPKIRTFLSSYDFLLLSLQPLWLQNQYKYNPRQMPLTQQQLAKKFASFCLELEELRQIKWDQEKPLLASLNQKIDLLLGQIYLNQKETYLFRQNKGELSITRAKANFDLEVHFAAIFAKYTKVRVQTFLDFENFGLLLELSGLSDLFEKMEIEVDCLEENEQETQILASLVLQDFLTEKLALAEGERKPIFLLCGQNSVLQDAQAILTSKFNPHQYLTIGESGGITKIGSKLSPTFCGLVVIKSSDVHFLLRLENLPPVSEVWFLSQPYLFVGDWWWQKANQSGNKEEFMYDLKDIYIQNQINLVREKLHCPVGFVRSFQ